MAATRGHPSKTRLKHGADAESRDLVVAGGQVEGELHRPRPLAFDWQSADPEAASASIKKRRRGTGRTSRVALLASAGA